jgi:hypothetical protein
MKDFIQKLSLDLQNFFSRKNLLTSHFIPHHLKTFVIISIVILAIAIIIKIQFSWKYRKMPVYHKMIDLIFTWLLTTSLISFFLLFSNWQTFGLFSYLFWWYLLSLTFIVWGCIICIYRVKKFPEELENYINSKNREKYLPRRKPGLRKLRRR